jgi:hypothetical protein
MDNAPQPLRLNWQNFLQTKSAWVLVAVNLIPIWGVLFDNWTIFSVVFLFWTENVVIGLFNIAKMLTYGFLGNTGPSEDHPGGSDSRGLMLAGMTFLSAFFTVHYGMFCFGHGVFVVSLLGGQAGHGFPNPFARALHELNGELRYAILAMILSHGFSFVANYLRGGEYKQVNSQQLMSAPYGRIVILHLAIIFGAFVSLALGSGMGILLLVIVGKIILDVKLHLKERERGIVSLFSRRPRGTI